MSKTWITSDLHFGHANILKFNPETRQFKDVEHMNSEMIRMWNELVKPDDLVYITGDVAFCNAKRATEIVNSLNGRKILIAGNHDSKLIKDQSFRECFKEIHQYLTVNYNGTRIVMFHYPIFDHDQCGRGSIMLHGHRHGNPTGIPGRIMDVGMDATGNVVTSLDEVISKLLKVNPMNHHSPR